MADTPAPTPEIGQLVQIGHMFNSIAFRSFDSQEAADAGNELFSQNKGTLDAIQSELAPLEAEEGEQMAIIQANQPPVSVWSQLGEMMGFDPAELDDEGRESIKAFAISRFGVPAEEFDKPVETDPENIAQAKALAVEAAIQRLEEIGKQSDVVSLKLEEAVASLLKQALTEEKFNSIVGERIRFASEEAPAVISAGFASNNAPTLASAFAPKPQV